MRKTPEVGDLVIYHDENARAHNALITCVHSEYMINCLYVSSDPDKRDNYGRQIERPSSVAMAGVDSPHLHSLAHGRYARYSVDPIVQIKAPLAV